MNDFWQRVWWDNRIEDYLIVLGVIVFVVLIKKFISHYFAGLLFVIVKKIWKGIEKKPFTDLIVHPLGVFLSVMVAILSLHRLHFPKYLDIEIYHFTLRQFVYSIGTIIFIVVFIRLLLRIIDFLAFMLQQKANLTSDQTDNQLIVFFKDFFKAILVILSVLLILKYAFNLNISSLLTGLSIVGAAIALALRESIENLIASFVIFFDKPFTTGDTVKVQNITGSVEKIGLRSTRIRTDQKTFVTVPNKQMVDTILDNLSLRTQRKVELRLEIHLSTCSQKLEALVNGVRQILSAEKIVTADVYVADITGKNFLIQSDYFTAMITDKEFNALRQNVNLQILKLMEELQIEMAGASTNVRISDSSETKINSMQS